MKNLKIDKFYLVFLGILIVLAVMVIFTLRVIFSSISIAEEINEELFTTNTPRIDKEKINSALESLKDKQQLPLDLRL